MALDNSRWLLWPQGFFRKKSLSWLWQIGLSDRICFCNRFTHSLHSRLKDEPMATARDR